MLKPDYHNSIVNLAVSLAAGFDAPTGLYPPLKQLPTTTVAAADHVVLLIVDGLGFDYVIAGGGVFADHLQEPLTSVFPSSTAPAITSLMTASAPQQHGVSGWFMLLREIGAVGLLLPSRLRGGGELATTAFSACDFISGSSVFDQVSAATAGHFLITEPLRNSSYSRATAGSAQRHAYHGLSDLPGAIGKLITHSNKAAGRCLVSAYWPQFDALCHVAGVASVAVKRHYDELSRTYAELLRVLQGTNTLVVVTADHGFIDVEPQTAIGLHDHPELQDTLAQPLCGEPRAAYCHVRAGAAARFERYVTDALGAYFDCQPSESLVADGWFGLGDRNPQLLSRVGDYTLIARANYVIYDRLRGEPPWSLIGVHGGVSSAEMQVPLIMTHC